MLDHAMQDELPAIAARISKPLTLAIADLLLVQPNDHLNTKAVDLAKLCRRTALVGRCWRFIADISPQAGLVEVVRNGIEHELTHAITPDTRAYDRVEKWFASNDLPTNLLRDLEKDETTLDDWVGGLPELTCEIKLDSHLIDELKCRILSVGERPTLDRHKRNLLFWIESLSADSRATLREHFAANYLDKLSEGKQWQEDIVDWVFKHFGKPIPGALVDHWRRIDRRSPGVVQALLSWLALRELERFFGEANDPHGRFKFWKENFANDFAEVRPLAQRQAMLLHIPPIAVVEFADVGNAAYVYPDSELSWLAVKTSYELAYYKNREKLIQKPSSSQEFRIIHSGGWQYSCVHDLKALIKPRGRRR
ncbi:MAG: hypothetical protein RIC89_21930 [Pseudomonadales bacterium]